MLVGSLGTGLLAQDSHDRLGLYGVIYGTGAKDPYFPEGLYLCGYKDKPRAAILHPQACLPNAVFLFHIVCTHLSEEERVPQPQGEDEPSFGGSLVQTGKMMVSGLGYHVLGICHQLSLTYHWPLNVPSPAEAVLVNKCPWDL